MPGCAPTPGSELAFLHPNWAPGLCVLRSTRIALRIDLRCSRGASIDWRLPAAITPDTGSSNKASCFCATGCPAMSQAPWRSRDGAKRKPRFHFTSPNRPLQACCEAPITRCLPGASARPTVERAQVPTSATRRRMNPINTRCVFGLALVLLLLGVWSGSAWSAMPTEVQTAFRPALNSYQDAELDGISARLLHRIQASAI